MTTVVDLATQKRIAEANAHGDASAWTARDVLVETLRMIDAGEAHPHCLAVAWTERGTTPDGAIYVTPRFNIATPGGTEYGHYQAVHLAEAFKQAVWDGAQE